jgi:hypothetical protein
MLMAEGINSIEELRKAQAAAQAQGSSITNYEEWANILEDLSTAGVQSTGNYASDVRLHSRLMAQIEEAVEQMEVQQAQNKIQPQHNEIDKTDYKSAKDSEQNIKASIVNSTSSSIMADYMKYYHLLS